MTGRTRAASVLPSSARRRNRLRRAPTAANSAATNSAVPRIRRAMIPDASSILRDGTAKRPKALGFSLEPRARPLFSAKRDDGIDFRGAQAGDGTRGQRDRDQYAAHDGERQ